MEPAIFDTETLPFDDMWPDDKIWLPHLVAGRTDIFYRFTFNEKGEMIRDEEEIDRSAFPDADE